MYNTFEEKNENFGLLPKVETLDQLDKLKNKLSRNLNNRFRGVCEAKYYMLTSLQRLCPIGISNKDYMRGLLSNVKGDSTIKNFFEDNNIYINDLSCLSLMQHLGMPTPLLDFTIDINIALSFAADGAKMYDTTTETDDYCSLYYFDLSKEMEINNANVQNVLSSGMHEAEKLCDEFNKANSMIHLDDSKLRKINKFVTWDDLASLEIALVEYQGLATQVRTLDNQELDTTNSNLLNQKGAFVINQFDDKMPLEENWNMRTNASRHKLISSLPSGSSLLFSGIYTKEKMSCVDINKKVILKWKQKHPIELYDNSKGFEALKKRLCAIKDNYNKSV
ncbi:hypothetical protein prwr041_24890 [Prevotella herbatica]|uniref:FRG domain-containing protein n=1 Tax=Prevotella herbatica TaxID=2801997 RepID=A0ABM7P1F0_9BACT|nr:FRG domain-containing protein [Prevotella herbatica]BCS86596.1 hypothetical protein prwr041_24890 [Prevotella herbatica]